MFAVTADSAVAQTVVPDVLFAGSANREIRIGSVPFLPEYQARWNGEARPSVFQFSEVKVQLTEEDVARSIVGELTLIDPRTEAVVASRLVSVVYNVNVSEALYDARRKRFYLTTPFQSAEPLFPGNSLIVFDPETQQVSTVLPVGLGPQNMAMSDDGRKLYVAVDGDGVVRGIDLDTMTVQSEFRFRQPFSGDVRGTFARSAIAVMPGRPDTVAIYYNANATAASARLAVFDRDLKRGSEVNESSGYDGLLFSPEGDALFLGSYRTVNAPVTVRRYGVEAAGVSRQSPTEAAGGAPVVITGGLLYTSGGTVVDPKTMELTGRLGVAGSVAVDGENQRLLVMHNRALGGYAATGEYLQAFDLGTQQALGWLSTFTNPVPTVTSSPVQRLLRFGENGLLYTSARGLLVFQTPMAGPAPRTESRAVVNAASQRGGPIAPGEILTIYGVNLGPEKPRSAVLNLQGRFDKGLAGVEVLFGGLSGTVLLASSGQVNVIAPFGIPAGRTVDMQVVRAGIPSARVPMAVNAAARGLFTRTGTGQGGVAVINQDGTVNTAAARGSVITVFGTGGGLTGRPTDSVLAPGADALRSAVQATIGGREAVVFYAGAAPLLPQGVFQMNLQIPADLAAGEAAVRVRVNGQESAEGVTIAIR